MNGPSTQEVLSCLFDVAYVASAMLDAFISTLAAQPETIRATTREKPLNIMSLNALKYLLGALPLG
jgi:hypothetical protein